MKPNSTYNPGEFVEFNRGLVDTDTGQGWDEIGRDRDPHLATVREVLNLSGAPADAGAVAVMIARVLSPDEEDQLLRLYCAIADATSDGCVQARNVMPSALQCLLHVFEEHVGTYGFLVVRHVLISPLWTACDRPIEPGALVQVGNDVVVDRSWCRSCAAVVAAEKERRHEALRAPDGLAAARAKVSL